MDTQSAQAEQLPKAVRSFIRVSNYIEKVLDTVERAAREARAVAEAAAKPPAKGRASRSAEPGRATV